jgi:hypothetical protein
MVQTIIPICGRKDDIKNYELCLLAQTRHSQNTSQIELANMNISDIQKKIDKLDDWGVSIKGESWLEIVELGKLWKKIKEDQQDIFNKPGFLTLKNKNKAVWEVLSNNDIKEEFVQTLVDKNQNLTDVVNNLTESVTKSSRLRY